ncbi:Abortive infection protein [Desulfovibrio sp. X2]|uniref:CPBP family intramembrane glutamic endopeptidase n=1 Tax=Desulfovibrio sp. X2 TaxID=941449 RepID=UPI000358DC44|nr:CPBP family intramembrane glutamic endopeptidase [Desulfovibrio sp. X2]EPR37079.1 Abortive infection protein [Desulfovibrio sp. X2]
MIPRGVLAFLGISFGLAWTVWEVLASRGFGPGDPRVALYTLCASFAPAVAAVVVRTAVTREGFADAGLRPRLKRSWPYYLAAWLLPLPAAALVLWLGQVLGLAQPDWTLARGVAELVSRAPDAGAYLKGAGTARVVGSALFASLAGSLVFFGEEFGWRGWLQQRIAPGRPLRAAVVTGLVWSLWHLPLNLRGYNFPGHPVSGQIAFTASLVCLSIIFGWLRECSGSIWCASLAHAATNSIGGSLVALALAGGADAGGVAVAYFGWLGLVPLGGLALWIVMSGRLAPLAEAA